jgi:hypothetical protein
MAIVLESVDEEKGAAAGLFTSALTAGIGCFDEELAVLDMLSIVYIDFDRRTLIGRC